MVWGIRLFCIIFTLYTAQGCIAPYRGMGEYRPQGYQNWGVYKCHHMDEDTLECVKP